MNPYIENMGDASRLIICFPNKHGEPEIAALVTDTNGDFIPEQLMTAIRKALYIYKDEESRLILGFVGAMKYVLVGNTVDDDYHASHVEWAVLDALTVKHGFKWGFIGWDEEPRFVAHGSARTSHPKVIIDYEGRYVIKPRCRLCHERTGWCRCFETLEEAVECLESEKHYCDVCIEMLTLEKWLKGGDAIGLPSFWSYLEDNDIIDRGDEYDDLIDLELVVEHFKFNYDQWLVEESENWDCEDDTYCECPLEG